MAKKARFKKSQAHAPKQNTRAQRPPKAGGRGKSPQAAASSRPEGRAIVGTHAVKECLLHNNRGAQALWVKEGATGSDIEEILKLAESCRIPVREKAPRALDGIAHQHQNICLFAGPAPEWDWDSLESEPSRILILDQLEDPHNLGAIIRTAWLMGVKGILATEHRSVGLTPAVHKVASGGVEHVPVLFQSNFSPVTERLKEIGFWIYGLAAEGSSPLYGQSFPGKVAVVVGSEESGMRKSTQKLCDELVSIPQISVGASYNASVAAGIVISEVYRQQI